MKAKIIDMAWICHTTGHVYIAVDEKGRHLHFHHCNVHKSHPGGPLKIGQWVEYPVKNGDVAGPVRPIKESKNA